MSRLADRLVGLERGTSRPQSTGEIAGLGGSPAHPARWRPAALLVIVAGMLAVPVALVWPAKNVVNPLAPTATSMLMSLPPPAKPARAAGIESAEAVLAQAMQAVSDGALQEAEQLFRRALELRPADAEAWNRLGVVLAREGARANGVEAFTTALRIDPGHCEAHRNLAIIRDGEGRADEAVAHYRAFLLLSRPDDAGREAVGRRLAELAPSEARQ